MSECNCNDKQSDVNKQSGIGGINKAGINQAQGQAQMGFYPNQFGTGTCPYCQPRCPCCGRPIGNWNYPYYPYGYNQVTC